MDSVASFALKKFNVLYAMRIFTLGHHLSKKGLLQLGQMI